MNDASGVKMIVRTEVMKFDHTNKDEGEHKETVVVETLLMGDESITLHREVLPGTDQPAPPREG